MGRLENSVRIPNLPIPISNLIKTTGDQADRRLFT
jgi:hypothetical protein